MTKKPVSPEKADSPALFKKKTPTMLECLTMGRRYPTDSHMVEAMVARIRYTQ